MTNEKKILFEQNYNGVDISTEDIEKLLGYLDICKYIKEKQEILQCKFQKIDNDKFTFNGISTIKEKAENRCFNGIITFFENKITVEQEITRLFGKEPKTEVINTKDIFIKENNRIYRKSIISGKEYFDEIKDIKKNYRKY